MARNISSGLSIGQLLTLSFGFIVASVLIFALGWWVGYDAAHQRGYAERQPVRVAVQPLAAITAPPAPPTRVPPPPPTMTRPLAVAVLPSPTFTRLMELRTPTRQPARETTAGRGGGAWSVQVKATPEAVEAVVFARQLREKGYDAYTVQAPIGGVTWYRVRVGRFQDRAAAKNLEQRLREREGLEAAYVTKD